MPRVLSDKNDNARCARSISASPTQTERTASRTHSLIFGLLTFVLLVIEQRRFFMLAVFAGRLDVKDDSVGIVDNDHGLDLNIMKSAQLIDIASVDIPRQ